MNLCEEGSHEEDPERHHAQGSHWGELDHDEEEVFLHVEQNKRGIMPKAATAEKYEGCDNEVTLSKDDGTNNAGMEWTLTTTPKMTTATSAATCGDKGHGDGEVDVPVEEQGPEVGSSASRTGAQDKEAEPELNRM